MAHGFCVGKRQAQTKYDRHKRRCLGFRWMDSGNSASICNMTQQLVELANYFGLDLAPAPQAADDNWICPGRGGNDQILARGLLQHLIIALHYSPSCATSSRMVTITLDRAGQL